MQIMLRFILLIASVLAASKSLAQHYYYIPNTAQMPYLGQRHDAGISFGWGRGSAAKVLELQGYYSPVNRVAIIASYMNSGEKEVLKNIQEGLKYRFYELGAGVYEPLPFGTASLIAGYGHGDMYNYFQGDEYADLNLDRWFIQPSIMYHDEFFQAGFCLRLSRVKFNNGKVAIAIPPIELDAIERIEEKSPFFLPEVGLNGALRLEPFLLGVNVCGIYPRTDDVNFGRITSNLFLSVELGNLFRGKKKTPPAS